MGMEEATKEGQLQEPFLQETPMTSRTTHGRMGQRLREWDASHEDRRAEGVVQEYGLASFRERNFTLERQERV